MAAVYTPGFLSRGHAAEARMRSEIAATRYQSFVQSRRGVVIHLKSLERSLGRVPTHYDVSQAHALGKGPSAETLGGPFDGKFNDAVEAIRFDDIIDKADAKVAQQFAKHPFQMILVDILQRHPKTKLANIERYNTRETQGTGDYDDIVEFSFADKPSVRYTVAANLSDFWTMLFINDDATGTEGNYVLKNTASGPRVWDHEKYRLMKREEETAFIAALRFLHGRLEQEGVLAEQYRDDLHLLPEAIIETGEAA